MLQKVFTSSKKKKALMFWHPFFFLLLPVRTISCSYIWDTHFFITSWSVVSYLKHHSLAYHAILLLCSRSVYWYSHKSHTGRYLDHRVYIYGLLSHSPNICCTGWSLLLSLNLFLFLLPSLFVSVSLFLSFPYPLSFSTLKSVVSF